MSNMTIQVEFIAGTGIEDAITEAIEKAKLLNIAYVKFNFNGIKFAIGQSANIAKVLQDYANIHNYASKPIIHS